MLLLARLAVHYYRPDFTPGQAKLLIQDLADDLDEFTLAEIEVAIRAYRISPENRFFPRSADLRAHIIGDRKHRREVGSGGQIKSEFGDSRPLCWEMQPVKFWKPHWRVEDLDSARDPDRRARYDRWVAAKAGDVKGEKAK